MRGDTTPVVWVVRWMPQAEAQSCTLHSQALARVFRVGLAVWRICASRVES